MVVYDNVQHIMNIKGIKKEIQKAAPILMKKKIIILSGGFSEERKASLYSAKQVAKTLSQNGFSTVIVDPSKTLFFHSLNPFKDIVFNCLHGSFGESGHVSGILDYLRVPYTFSNIYASAMCMDKIFLKAMAAKLGLGCPWDCYDRRDIKKAKDVLYIHKKRRGGGSVGASIKHYALPVRNGFFSEQFINGRILTLGVLENGGIFLPLSIIQIHTHGSSYYSKRLKYSDGGVSFSKYNGPAVEKIKEQAVRLLDLLGVSACARVDLIEKNGALYFLEINTIPGLYEESNLAVSAQFSGLSFYELLLWILKKASFFPLI